jgi:hypothetical protein
MPYAAKSEAGQGRQAGASPSFWEGGSWVSLRRAPAPQPGFTPSPRPVRSAVPAANSLTDFSPIRIDPDAFLIDSALQLEIAATSTKQRPAYVSNR